VYLNLVLEFVPETVYRISKHYAKNGQRMPPLYVKLYVYQMCRALGYIHSLGVCHRDIKPQACLVSLLPLAAGPLSRDAKASRLLANIIFSKILCLRALCVECCFVCFSTRAQVCSRAACCCN